MNSIFLNKDNFPISYLQRKWEHSGCRVGKEAHSSMIGYPTKNYISIAQKPMYVFSTFQLFPYDQREIALFENSGYMNFAAFVYAKRLQHELPHCSTAKKGLQLITLYALYYYQQSILQVSIILSERQDFNLQFTNVFRHHGTLSIKQNKKQFRKVFF